MSTKIKIFVLLLIFSQHSCTTSELKSESVQAEAVQATVNPDTEKAAEAAIIVGAEQLDGYLGFFEKKRLGLVVNQTSMVRTIHLVDTLVRSGVNIQAVFAPEHGFRGDADAGEKIANGRDPKTGIPIISLYGKHKEPSAEDLANIDILVFDIQDVGARFYTYISTLHYVMQAAAKHGKLVIVLDRPNPNGHYVDGPVLDPDYQSFVGMHPVPVVHGMTVGEYALMINGEGWLDNDLEADLIVIRCANYTHNTPYNLPIPPSPNLPNMRSIYLYPSLCFFEGTVFSVGRGTNTQFQVYGHPDYEGSQYSFRPHAGPGAKYPKLEHQDCRGVSLLHLSPETIRAESRLNLSHLLNAYQRYPDKRNFFLPNHFVDKLAGGNVLREQITAGWTEEQIRASWQEKLHAFKLKRAAYLLYE